MKRARVKGYHWLGVVRSAYTRDFANGLVSKMAVSDVMCNPASLPCAARRIDTSRYDRARHAGDRGCVQHIHLQAQ